jgi:NAD(P)-dependent dehydrogenase (short-subunit alcohol dehydrogenase family)
MLMSPSAALERFFGAVEAYPELAGKRVLITGITADHGIDIARAFAEHKARLVLQIDQPCAETEALGEVIAPIAADLNIFSGPLASADDIVALARRAMSTYGGIDAVVVLVPLSLGDATDGSLAAIEARISQVLLAPCLIARVAANRMRLLGTEGLILHVASLPTDASAQDYAFASAAKATLAVMTRSDARTWGADGIRVNAVAPETGSSTGHGLAGETDVAALALFLAAGRGASLSGQVFEADQRSNR